MRRALALLFALFLAPMVGNAEVRLRAGDAGPELVVQPVARGVWTPRTAPDIYTVNPSGDLLGDGFPAHASAGGRLVAAWQRPAHGALVVLHATDPTSTTSSEIPTTDGAGVPIVTVLDSGSLVTWQSGFALPEVTAVLATDGGVSPPVSLVSGRLVGVYRVGDVVHVVAFDAVGSAFNIGMMPSSWLPLPIPIGVSRVPLPRTFGAVPLEATPPPEFITNPMTWQPCVEERDDDVLLAWSAGRGVLGRVTLDATGVTGTGEFFRAPNGSCQCLLNSAARH